MAALAVEPNGWTEISSIPVVAPGNARTSASFDLQVPQNVPWGSTELIVRSPSSQFRQSLGSRSLSNLQVGSFQSIQFDVPPHVQEVLESNATDVAFTLVINAPPGLGAFYVDNLDVSGPASPEGQGEEIVLPLPLNLHPSNVVVAGTHSVKVDDRSKVMDGTGQAPGAVASGGGELYLGVGSLVGAATSGGHVELRNGALVDGDLWTAATVHMEPDSQITGELVQGADLEPYGDSAWTPEFVGGPGTEVVLEPSQSETIAPGSFGRMHIKSGSSVNLSPGVYRFPEVFLEPESNLVLTSTDRPTVIYIDGSLTFRGKIIDGSQPTNTRIPLLVVALGSSQVPVERPFFGTLFAPNASVSVIGGTHRGAFFGYDVELHPEAIVEHEPFPWSAVLSRPHACTGNGVEVVGLEGDLADLYAGNETLPGGKRVDHLPEIKVAFSQPVEPALVTAHLTGRISTTASGDCTRDRRGDRQSETVALRSSASGWSSLVTLVPEEPLKLGCYYKLALHANVPVTSGGECLTEKFEFTEILVEEELDSTRALREFQRAISRQPQDTLGLVEIASGVNTPVEAALDRYIADFGLVPGRHAFVPPSQLSPSALHAGMEEGFYQLFYDGIPVHGHGFNVASQAGFMRKVFGKVARTDIGTIPVVDADSAMDNVMTQRGLSHPFPWKSGGYFTPSPTLEIRKSTQHVKSDGDYRLVWNINFTGAGVPGLDSATVDATSGAVLSTSVARQDCTVLTGEELDETELRDGGPDTPLNYSNSSAFNMSVIPPYGLLNPNTEGTWFTQDNIDYKVFARQVSGWSFEVGQAPTGDSEINHEIPDGVVECDPNGDRLVDYRERNDPFYPLAAVVFAAADRNANVLNDSPFEVAGDTFAGVSNHRPKSEQVLKMWVGDANWAAEVPVGYYDPNSPPEAPMLFFPLNGVEQSAHSTVGHEMGHVVSHGIHRTLGADRLDREGESGALEEGFADIMSAWFAQNEASPFEYESSAGVTRLLDDPSVHNRPDMYEEAPHWVTIGATCNEGNDLCGRHTNSAVFAHWFSIVAEGRAGLPNNLGCYPNIEPLDSSIGESMRRAFQIVVDAWSQISPDAGYEEMREATAYAAQQRYGDREAQIVSSAWYSVGVFGGMDPTSSAGRIPANGATRVEPWDATLEWEVPSDGSLWRYQVATDQAFEHVVAEGEADGYSGGSTRVANASVTLSASTKYYWRYMDQNADDWSQCSVVPSEFRTAARRVEMQFPEVDTTANPDNAVTVAIQSPGLLITENDTDERTLEWGIGECDAPMEYAVYEGVGRASIGDNFQPEHPEFEEYPKIGTQAGLDLERATLVYVREIKDDGVAGSCSYFKVRVPDLEPFHMISHGTYTTDMQFSDFGDVELEWSSAGEGAEYEVLLYNALRGSSLDPETTFTTTETTLSLADYARPATEGYGIWSFQVRARSEGMLSSSRGYRWVAEHSFDPISHPYFTPRSYYVIKSAPVRPVVEDFISYDDEARIITVQRPWDNGQPGSEGEAQVSFEPGLTNTNYVDFEVLSPGTAPREPDHRRAKFLREWGTYEPAPYSLPPIVGSDATPQWELSVTGYGGGDLIVGVPYPESAGPTTLWTIEFDEEEPECLDLNTDFSIPGLGYLPTTAGSCSDVVVPFDIPEGVNDGYTGPFDVGEAILDGCITRIPTNLLGASFPAVPNAFRYDYTIGLETVFSNGHTSDVSQTIEIPYTTGEVTPPSELITWQDRPLRHGVPSERWEEARAHSGVAGQNGKDYFEGCVAAITVRAYGHEDCGSDSFVDSRTSWVFIDAGAYNCLPENTPSSGDTVRADEEANYCDNVSNVDKTLCQGTYRDECTDFSQNPCKAWADWKCSQGHGDDWCL